MTAITDQQIQEAADELCELIVRKLGDQADRLLGRPELGSDEWVLEQKEMARPGLEPGTPRFSGTST